MASLGIEDLELSEWEDVPSEAMAALEASSPWIGWARECVPEMIDLKNVSVRGGFFADDGTCRGLIWDLREAFVSSKDADFRARVFDFVLRCFRSDDEELYSPAGIAFLCKVAKSDAEGQCSKEPKRFQLNFDDLASFLTKKDIMNAEGLFEHHYGLSAVSQMIAFKERGRAV